MLVHLLNAATIIAFSLIGGDFFASAAVLRKRTRQLSSNELLILSCYAEKASADVESFCQFRAVLATRFGLLFTVLGLIVAFVSSEGSDIPLSALGVALLTTGAGLCIATGYEYLARRWNHSVAQHAKEERPYDREETQWLPRKGREYPQVAGVAFDGSAHEICGSPSHNGLSDEAVRDIAGMGPMCDADLRF